MTRERYSNSLYQPAPAPPRAARPARTVRVSSDHQAWPAPCRRSLPQACCGSGCPSTLREEYDQRVERERLLRFELKGRGSAGPLLGRWLRGNPVRPRERLSRGCPRNCKRPVAVATCHWYRKAPGRPDSSTDPQARRPAATVGNVLGRGVPVSCLQRMASATRIPACVRSAHAPNQWGMPMNMPFRSHDASGAVSLRVALLFNPLSRSG